jgi:gamma-glutamyltranspeptidase/glutathione hydrolase
MSAMGVDDGHPWTPVPLARGRHGAVVAPHHLATEAGLHVLRQGGSAVDAAIATNAVLGVVMPHACGLGGDAFWLIWDAATGRQTALNGSGRAPSGADAAALRAKGLAQLPRRGPLAITVPGAVRSWGDAHARHGRLTRDAVLGPAIELARSGFPAWDDLIAAVEGTAGRITDVPGVAEGFHAIYRPHGRAWRPGEIVRLPALAATLERVARDGFDAFYDGDLGERQAAGLAAVGSAITARDLARHTSTWTEPIAIDYRGVRVTTHPPNSSGLIALELLAILERFEAPPSEAFGPDGVTDPTWIHLGLEAAKLVMADRDATLTDPAFRAGQVEALLDPAHIADLAARIDPRRAAPPPPATNPRGGGTIYLATVDAEGNAVSLIESNYMGFGSGVVDPVTGIHYQNRGSYFSLDPGHPNLLEPGKRTLHTLLPGMLFRAGQPGPWIVAGAMGGDAQPQVHAQFVSAVVDGGVDVRTAVAAPRWFIEPPDHFQPPVDVHLEPRHAAGVAEAVAAMGHRLVATEPFDSGLGHEHAIELIAGGPADPDGSVAAATDPRSAGLPAVW